jgi:hypothetical protein
MAAGLRGDLVIDLTRPLGAAPEGPLVAAARSGAIPADADPLRPPSLAQPAAPVGVVAAPVRPARPMLVVDDDEPRLGPPPLDAPLHAGALGPPTLAARSRLQPPALQGKRSYRNVWIVVGGITALSLAANVVFLIRQNSNHTVAERPAQPIKNDTTASTAQTPDVAPQAAQNDDPTLAPEKTDQPPKQVDAPPSKPPASNNSETPSSGDPSPPAGEPPSTTPTSPAVESSSQPSTTEGTPPKAEPPPSKAEPPKPVRLGSYIPNEPLPPLDVNVPIRLATFSSGLTTPFTKVSLIVGKGTNNQTVRLDGSGSDNTWQFIAPGGGGVEPAPVGRVFLTRHESTHDLMFEWLPEGRTRASSCESLRSAALRLDQEVGEPQILWLQAPVVASRLAFTPQFRIKIAIPANLKLIEVPMEELTITLDRMEGLPAQGEARWKEIGDNTRHRVFHHPEEKNYQLALKIIKTGSPPVFLVDGELSWQAGEIRLTTDYSDELKSYRSKEKALTDAKTAVADRETELAEAKRMKKGVDGAMMRLATAQSQQTSAEIALNGDFPVIVKSNVGQRLIDAIAPNEKPPGELTITVSRRLNHNGDSIEIPLVEFKDERSDQVKK